MYSATTSLLASGGGDSGSYKAGGELYLITLSTQNSEVTWYKQICIS